MTPITWSQGPDQKEIVRKKLELEELEQELAEKELDLSTARRDLNLFENSYQQKVGCKYAELDRLKASVLDMATRIHPDSKDFKSQAEAAREHAEQSAHNWEVHQEEADMDLSEPSEELKKMFRDAAKKIHPDLTTDPEERERRHALMARLNRYGKAAEKGHDGAQFNLGRMLYHGLGTSQDRDRGREWIRKSAELGFADAQLFMGICYEEGNGVPQDYSQAADEYRKAAEQGKEMAQYHLGNLYKKGLGVEKNLDKAVKWFRQAAERKYLPAVGSLKKFLHQKTMFPEIQDDDPPPPVNFNNIVISRISLYWL